MKQCLVCGTDFKPNSPTHKYCSKKCSRSVRNDNRNKFSREELDSEKSRKCLVCGTEFPIDSKRIRKKYCSKHCSKKAERIFGGKRETDLKYKDKIRFSGNKYKVLERDEYKCQICGNIHKLVIHHKDDSGQGENPNNDMDNLVTLCRRCHINIHKII